jgi:catechol 2,3-dioxygenase-like lactoylglutathione lyase family enzyme
MTTSKNKPGYQNRKYTTYFSVKDIAVSREFYVSKLGFEEAEWGDNNFTSVSRDHCGIYLCRGDREIPERGYGSALMAIYFHYTMNYREKK